MNTILLANDKIQMGILPEIGGSVSFLKYKKLNEFKDILRPMDTSKPLDAINSALFVMMPFCSVIRGGEFTYWGITRKMQKNQAGFKDPLNGDAWKSAFDIVDQTATKLHLKYVHKKEDGGYPFSYEGTLIYELDGANLKISLGIENLNPLPMPCGLGINPYFNKTKDVSMRFINDMVWYNSTDPILDKPYKVPEAWDFSTQKELKNAVFDTCFDGFKGYANISYPTDGIIVDIKTDDLFKHSILSTPKGKNYFSFNPVTNATNAFNLASKGALGTGIQSIGPKESLSTTINITVRG